MQERQNLSKSGDDNRSDQLNPNNDAYWQSRGEDERPDDWEARIRGDDDEYYDGVYDSPHEISATESKRLREEEEAKRKKIEEAQKEISEIEQQAGKIAEKMFNNIFMAYDNALELRSACAHAYSIANKYEDDGVHFNIPLTNNLAPSLADLIRQYVTLFMPPSSLKQKVIMQMDSRGLKSRY